MSRIMAVDYGRKRTGIAVSDPCGIIANGLTTVATADLLHFILDYVSRESVVTIVVGYPKQMSGKDSENAAPAITFVNHLRKALPAVKVEWYDERFTSVLAHRTMIDAGLSKQRRRNKELVDEISATIILQSYMEYCRNRLT